MSPRNPEHIEDHRLPPAVTFTTGAELLVKEGIVDSITREGVRHIATSKKYRDTWPFGPDKEYPYGRAQGALLMATEPFLDWFRTHYGRAPEDVPESEPKPD